ncbi:MAG: hypothetical protein SFV54_11495, partial [Bryobacteraceae bacterium]|nr:hypothetical protein [Bryobacteraceae bacterium]
RIGAAYQLSSKLVLRGGYGLYFLNPNNDFLKTTGFSTNTPLVNSLDDGRSLASNNLLANPYPTGINRPSGASLGYATFVGQNYTWYNPTMRTPYVHQFSAGFQYQLGQASTIEFSYVGSRTRNANTERDFNLPSDLRQRCSLLEGGNPNFCNEQIPNPFRGVEAFRGTGFFTANTLSRFQLSRPFPQFNGNLLEQGRGESDIFYNSLQINYNVRMGRSLTLLANYTLSKMVERWGQSDPYANVAQQGLYFNDRPHYVKFSTVWELPFGRGKAIGQNAGAVVNKLIGGWSFSTYSQVSSGEPNNLNGNVIMLKDPLTKGGDWTGKVDWSKHQVQGWNPCVLRQFNDGSVRPQQFSIDRGCGTDTANYAWLMVADYAAARYTPSRSGQIRKQPLFNIDFAFSKMTSITEKVRAQFRLEAFNATNYYFFGRDSNFNTNPNDPNFGTLFPSQAWIGNGYPRQVQLGFKVLW